MFGNHHLNKKKLKIFIYSGEPAHFRDENFRALILEASYREFFLSVKYLHGGWLQGNTNESFEMTLYKGIQKVIKLWRVSNDRLSNVMVLANE